MRRKISILFALTAMWLSAGAQSNYYDMWFDANPGTMTHGTYTFGENEITVDLSVMPWPGLHFLNIVPHAEDGEAGPWKIIPVIFPEGWPNSTEIAMMEYWLTGYDKKPKHAPINDGAIALDIDISMVSAGLHFLNLRAMTKAGYAGPWKILPFIMPDGWPSCAEAASVEYWVSDYDKEMRNVPYNSEGATSLNVDLSDMTPGLHFLNYHVLTETGYAGPWEVIPFYLSEGKFGEEEMHYDYWIDSEGSGVQSGTGIMPGTVNLKMDTSLLTDGEHTFFFRAGNLTGTYGEVFSETFVIENGVAVSIEDIKETQPLHLTIRAEGGVLIIDSNVERDISIYQTNGMLVRKVHLTEGQNFIANLQPGIYIIESMRFILR